jgi:hypothetical protein
MKERIFCPICGKEIEYCGITAGEEFDDHLEEHEGE